MRGEDVCLWRCCCCHWHVHLLLLVRRGCAADVGAGLVCPCGMFRWCCQVPELATITRVETTVWSANGVRTVAGVQVPLASCRRTCWPVWSGGRSRALRSWYFFFVRWRACRFLWTAVSWGVGGEEREVGSELPGV